MKPRNMIQQLNPLASLCNLNGQLNNELTLSHLGGGADSAPLADFP